MNENGWPCQSGLEEDKSDSFMLSRSRPGPCPELYPTPMLHSLRRHFRHQPTTWAHTRTSPEPSSRGSRVESSWQSQNSMVGPNEAYSAPSAVFHQPPQLGRLLERRLAMSRTLLSADKPRIRRGLRLKKAHGLISLREQKLLPFIEPNTPFSSDQHSQHTMGSNTKTVTRTSQQPGKQAGTVRLTSEPKSTRNLGKGIWELARFHTKESWLCWYPAGLFSLRNHR
jgi:hypothetical protein